MRSARAWWPAATLIAAFIGGCHCAGRPPDEEILRERIDTTSVHLYVTMKVAIGRSGSEPAAQRARAALLAAVASSSAVAHGGVHAVEAPSARQGASAAAGTARDLGALAWSLYRMRSIGREIVRGEKEDSLARVLPVLLAERGAPQALIDALDAQGEHALLLFALFVLKTHPKSPVPIPDEVVLYEASRADAARLRLTGFRTLLRSVKAFTLGQAELCDMASREAGAIAPAATAEDRAAFRRDVALLGGDASALEDAALERTHAAAAGLAHGQSALCYFDREQPDKARRELRAFVEAARRFGMPEEDLALVRAYLAYEDGDFATARRELELAKRSTTIDARERRRIDALIAYLGDRDGDDPFAEQFDRAFFASLFARAFLDALERAGVVDAVRASPVYEAVYGFVVTAGRTIGSARKAVPDKRDVAKAKGWIDRIFE